MELLSKRQREVLDFIVKFYAKKRYMPSITEIAKHFKITGATTHQHLSALQVKGAIERRQYQKRYIKVLEDNL